MHSPPLLFGQHMQHHPVPPLDTRVRIVAERSAWRGLVGTVRGRDQWGDERVLVQVEIRLSQGHSAGTFHGVSQVPWTCPRCHTTVLEEKDCHAQHR